MSDALDRLASTAGPLLRRVDAALAEAGAAPDHAIWPLLRMVRALPADAVAAVAEWRAAPVETAAAPLSAMGRRYAETVEALPGQPPWQGAGGEAYGRAWSALRAYVLASGRDSVVGRLRDTAAYLEATAEWIRRSRRALAVALAEVLGSGEAVLLVTGGQPPGPAAATIGAHVLAPVALACEEGERLHDDWQPRLRELPFHPVETVAPGRPSMIHITDGFS